MKRLAICAIIRDEAPYVAEWLAFHRCVGVSAFYLYDDGSTDGTGDIVRENDKGDIVLYRHSSHWDDPAYDGIPNPMNWHVTPQCRAFGHFAAFHAEGASWCAFIDVDEFLFHTGADSLPKALEPYEDQVGVVANWIVFGANGHQSKPDGLTIENYTRRGPAGQPDPWGRHVKTIVNCQRQFSWGPNGSHCPVFSDGRAPVDQMFTPNPWSMTNTPYVTGLRINHYYHRSYAEAVAKLTREYHGFPGYPGMDRLKAHDRNEVPDTEILRYVPQVKEMLKCD